MPIFATSKGTFSPLSIKSIHAAGSGAVSDYLIENSLKFNRASSTYLSRTPVASSNRKTWTWSGWVKRCDLDNGQNIFVGADHPSKSNSTHSAFYFHPNDQLYFGGWNSPYINTDATYPDPTGWYHIVLSVDTTQPTSTDRIKVYVNGNLQSYTTGSGFPAKDDVLGVNQAYPHYIGGNDPQSGYANQYMSEINFVDGVQLPASAFGETNANGVWSPKAIDSAPNNGTVWSTYLTTDDGSFDASYPKENAFNNDETTRTLTNTATINTSYIQFNSPVPLTGNLRVRCDNGNEIYDVTGGGSTLLGTNASGSDNQRVNCGDVTNLTSLKILMTGGSRPGISKITLDGITLVDGFNRFSNGTFYSNYLTGDIDTVYGATLGFDGETGLVGARTTANGTMVWEMPTPVDYSSSFNIYCALDGTSWGNTFTVTHAGGTTDFTSSVATGTTNTAVDLAQISGVTSPITKITITSGGSNPRFSAIEVDGTILTDATVGRNSFHLNFSNGIEDQSGTGNNWNPNNLLPTNYTGTVQFGAASPSDNTFDSPSTSTTKDTTGYSYSTVSNPKRDTGNANNATVLKTLDGTQIYWKFEDDNQNTNRYIHVSNNGINWTSPGAVYQTSTGAKVVGPSSWVVWAGGSNTDVTTVSWQGDVFKDSPTSDDASADTGLGGELVSGYSVLSPLAKAPSATLSNGNLTMTSGTNWESTLSTIPFIGGKWYYEVTTVNNQYSYVGVSRMSHNYLVDYPSKNKSWAMVNDGTCYYDQVGGNPISTSTGVSVGDYGTVGVAIDADNGKIWWAINGTWLNSGNPATGANPIFRNIPTDELLVACMDVYSNTGTVNFGATPFKYQAPSGFKCLCESNLADPAVPNPSSTAMTVVTYTGDGNSSKTIDCGFAPDIVWIKESTPTPTGGDFSHRISNSVFGAGNSMSTNLTNTLRDHSAEAGGGVETFTSTGFTVEQGTTNNNNQNNLNSDYVAWVWGGCSTPTHTATTYNQDQVWRNVGTITGTPWNDDNSSFKGVFNGVLGNTGGGNSAFANANTAYKYTFPSGGVPVTTNIEIYYWKNGGTLTVNAGEPDAYTITASTSAYTSDVINTISTLKNIQLETATNTGPYVSGIKVDGKLLVDADVLPIGVMNDQVYDQSVLWSDYITGTQYPTYSLTNAFDGDLSTRTMSNSATLLSFDPPSAITVNNKLELWLGYQDHTATQVLKVNGTDYSQLIDTTGYNQGWITIPDVTSLTKLEWGSTPSGSEDSSLSAIRIDGKILVDSGATPANVPNVPTYVRTNKDAGISIVGWEGVADAAPYHGMGKDPQLVITKSMTSSVAWRIWYSAFTDRAADFLGFDAGAIGTFGGTYWNLFNMNINTIGLPSSTYDNNVGDMVAYCFAEVPGFSRIGRYNNTQPFVTTGFTPRWLLLRDVTAENWCLYDSERGNTTRLEPNTTNGNVSNANIQVDFYSNGFKIVGAGSTINGDVLYAAFAERPQKLNLAV